MARKLFGKSYSSVVKHPGAFSAAAKDHGMPTDAFANYVLTDPHAAPERKKQARLAKAFKTMREEKKGR